MTATASIVEQFLRLGEAERETVFEALATERRRLRADAIRTSVETAEQLAEDERRFRDGPFVDADDMMDAMFGKDVATAARAAVARLS